MFRQFYSRSVDLCIQLFQYRLVAITNNLKPYKEAIPERLAVWIEKAQFDFLVLIENLDLFGHCDIYREISRLQNLDRSEVTERFNH